MSMMDEIRHAIRKGDIVYRLILINVIVFVVIGLLFVMLRLFTPGMSLPELRMAFDDKVLNYITVPYLPGALLHRPWTLITYMFTHLNIWHILFNMLMLYWFGRIFMQYLTAKQLLSTYILGGLAGAVFSMLFINLFPGLQEYLGGSMLGASAAIMAIVFAISFYVPDYTIYMLFLGPVRLKYVALGFVVIDVLMIASSNAGGNIAHLGGALYGFWFISRLKKGRDIGNWLNVFFDKLMSLFKPRPKLNVAYRSGKKKVTDEEFNLNKKAQQREVDRILDKIAKGGYDSLTKAEKETLFKMSENKD
jgi:membrane associated rhomboid family serine protease